MNLAHQSYSAASTQRKAMPTSTFPHDGSSSAVQSVRPETLELVRLLERSTNWGRTEAVGHDFRSTDARCNMTYHHAELTSLQAM